MGKLGLHIKITRRQMALGLASVVGTGLLIKYGISENEIEPETIELQLPDSSHIGPPSFDQFLALSRIVTVKETLNNEVAQKMFTVFMDEPWGPEHIKSTYRALYATTIAQAGKQDVPELLEGVKLTKGERWFFSHLLTTWYLGIYYHEERTTQRITYEGALMYDSLQGAIPIWFIGERKPGYWTEPPKAKETEKHEL
jgi:hypothetical protein